MIGTVIFVLLKEISEILLWLVTTLVWGLCLAGEL